MIFSMARARRIMDFGYGCRLRRRCVGHCRSPLMFRKHNSERSCHARRSCRIDFKVGGGLGQSSTPPLDRRLLSQFIGLRICDSGSPNYVSERIFKPSDRVRYPFPKQPLADAGSISLPL
jgi:hypothetical protein